MLDLSESAPFRVMWLVEKRPEISQREIADELGVALGRVNYILRALSDKGLVKIDNFRNSRNKLRYAYILTPEGIATRSALTAAFLRAKLREYDSLQAEIEALRADLKDTIQPQSRTGPPQGCPG
jgi:EPS-associated MarR family transcriptional regulator